MKKNNVAKKEEGMGMRAKVGIVLGVGAAIATTAGAYFLYETKKGEEVKEELKDYIVKIKKEVIKKLGGLKEVGESTYHNVIDEVVRKYNGVKNIDPKELDAIGADLKSHWKNIIKDIKIGSAKKKTTK